ncbi:MULTISPECIES: SIP domain-containing protein [Bacteria]|uniref:SIP domain-containing protein n=1 Tax=Bacteria TaxID=2 RepID=UPI003C7C205B
MASAPSALRDHFLLAGVTSDAPFLGRLLAALPDDGFGQVLIEGTGPSALRGWPGPAGISAHWVRQDLVPARDGRLPGPGAVLADAVRAWAAEWLPEPGTARPLPYTVWIGGAGCPPMDDLCRELLRDHPWLHLHHPAGLSAPGR